MGDPETADMPPALALRRLADEVDPPGASIAWLAAYDPARAVRDAAGMVLFLAARDPAVPSTLRRRIGRSAAPWLLRALHDPEVPDERKYPLGPLLGLFGVPVTEESYRACFQDLDAVRAAKAREAMRQILDRPDHLERVLDGLERAEDDPSDERGLAAALEVAAAICEHNPTVGVQLVAVLVATAAERGMDLELVPRALELASATRSGRAAWVFGELGRWPGMASIGERARELAMALNDLGVVAHAPRAAAFSHGYVAPLDGEGGRRLALFFRTDEGTLHGLLLRLSDVNGVEDACCVWHEASSFDEALRRTEPGLTPCDLELARRFIGDALAVHEDRDEAPPARLLLYRPFLGPEPLSIDKAEPRVGAYLLETVVPTPELVAGSEALMEHPAYGPLWPRSDAMTAVVARHAAGYALRVRAGATGTPGGAGGKRRMSGRSAAARRRALGQALAVSMDDADRAALVRRLGLNLELEARAGRARHPLNRMAARVWLALSEGLVPLEEIPYVRALCEEAAREIGRQLDSRARAGGGATRRKAV